MASLPLIRPQLPQGAGCGRAPADVTLIPPVALQAEGLDTLPGARFADVDAPIKRRTLRVVFQDLFEPPDASGVLQLTLPVSWYVSVRCPHCVLLPLNPAPAFLGSCRASAASQVESHQV